MRASDDEKRSDNFWPSDWSKLFWEEKERRQGEEEIEESRKVDKERTEEGRDLREVEKRREKVKRERE